MKTFYTPIIITSGNNNADISISIIDLILFFIIPSIIIRVIFYLVCTEIEEIFRDIYSVVRNLVEIIKLLYEIAVGTVKSSAMMSFDWKNIVKEDTHGKSV